jgi:hypothetical protein
MPSIPIYALSSKGENLSELGSSFTYRFKTPLQIPSGADCTLSLNQASLWYVTPNISVALNNNKMRFGMDLIESFSMVFVFKDGLYSLTALQAALRTKLIEYDSRLTGDEILITAENAQQKLIFSFNPTEATGAIRTWYGSDDNPDQFTMADFLGFKTNTEVVSEVSTDDPTLKAITDIGNDTAKFGKAVSHFILNCSLSSGSYDSEGNFNSSQIAQMFPISINPGSQLVHVPVNPIKTAAICAGQTISSCQFWLTNQDGVLQNMLGEVFSALVVLEY